MRIPFQTVKFLSISILSLFIITACRQTDTAVEEDGPTAVSSNSSTSSLPEEVTQSFITMCIEGNVAAAMESLTDEIRSVVATTGINPCQDFSDATNLS